MVNGRNPPDRLGREGKQHNNESKKRIRNPGTVPAAGVKDRMKLNQYFMKSYRLQR